MRTLYITAVLVACGGNPPGPGGLRPVIDLEDPAGPGVAASPGLDLTDEQAVWLAAEHLVPGMEWGSPSLQIPDQIWRIVTGPAVGDEGSCPYRIVEGRTTTWRSDCRSSEGYEWRGTVSIEDEIDGDGREIVRHIYDLEVWATTDDRDFDRAEIRGSVVDIQPDDEPLLQHIEANVAVTFEGWWAGRNQPEHEAVWTDLGWQGWAEAFADGEDIRWAMDMAVRVGPHGTLGFSSDSLVRGATCDDEPDGRAAVQASAEASFDFAGSRACDRCVEYAIDGDTFKACP